MKTLPNTRLLAIISRNAGTRQKISAIEKVLPHQNILANPVMSRKTVERESRNKNQGTTGRNTKIRSASIAK